MPAKRKLFDIKTEEVSLVDVAANLKRFIIVKNKKEELPMEEVLKVLEKIEKALNTLADKIVDVEKKLPVEPTEEELKKVGAKFSKDTLAQLKSLHETLGKLIAGNATEGVDDPTQKAAIDAFEKGLKSGFEVKKEDEKGISSEEIGAVVKAVMDQMEKK